MPLSGWSLSPWLPKDVWIYFNIWKSQNKCKCLHSLSQDAQDAQDLEFGFNRDYMVPSITKPTPSEDAKMKSAQSRFIYEIWSDGRPRPYNPRTMGFCMHIRSKMSELITCWSRQHLLYHVIMQTVKTNDLEKSILVRDTRREADTWLRREKPNSSSRLWFVLIVSWLFP